MSDKLTEIALKYKKSNSEEDFQALASCTRNVRKGLTRKYFVIGMEWEDLEQILLMQLPEIVQIFEPGNKFESFVKLCWKRSLITQIKRAQNYKNTTLNGATSIHNEETDEDNFWEPMDDAREPSAEFLHNEEFQELYKFVAEECTPMEKKVLNQYLQSKDYKQIAKKLRMDEKQVDNCLSRIKHKVIKKEDFKNGTKSPIDRD